MAKNLRTKKRRARVMLADGYRASYIQKELALKPETFHRWMKEPEFRESLATARHDREIAVERELMQLLNLVLQETTVFRGDETWAHERRQRTLNNVLNTMKIIGKERFFTGMAAENLPQTCHSSAPKKQKSADICPPSAAISPESAPVLPT